MATPKEIANGSSPQVPVASGGGAQTPKPMPYSPPVGPSGISDPKTPGIHGTNHGVCGTQGQR